MKNIIALVSSILSMVVSVYFQVLDYEFTLTNVFSNNDGFIQSGLMIVAIIVLLAVGIGFLISSIKSDGFSDVLTIVTTVVCVIAFFVSLTATLAGLIFIFVCGAIIWALANN